MTAGLVLAVYLAGYAWAAYRINAAMLRDSYGDVPDGWERLLSALTGLLAGLFWPLAAPIWLLIRTAPKTEKEIRAELREREQDIQRRERELGIGDDR